jgi:hypothetical protein
LKKLRTLEPKERTMTGLKLTQGLGPIEVGIKAFGNIDWNEELAATGQGIMRKLACYRQSHQISMLHFFTSYSGTPASTCIIGQWR